MLFSRKHVIERKLQTFTSKQNVLLGSNVRFQHQSFVLRSKLGDELLDFVTAGPKMRKWYGQGERVMTEKPEQYEGSPDEKETESVLKTQILITDADSPTGELVLLQLILSRAEIKAIVKDVVATRNSYGPYVEPVPIDVNDTKLLVKTLANCKAVIILGRLGAVPEACVKAGVPHILMLSSAGMLNKSTGFWGGAEDKLAEIRDFARERRLAAAGIPYTIVRCASVKDAPRSTSGVDVQPLEGDDLISEKTIGTFEAVSREDLAAIISDTLNMGPPSESGARIVIVKP